MFPAGTIEQKHKDRPSITLKILNYLTKDIFVVQMSTITEVNSDSLSLFSWLWKESHHLVHALARIQSVLC